ncbi:hypothetical protein F383_11165 [Gossypium arboreum]|uniref:Uncharacterized protein n=1 Tax=Gossypium arboreum TaxID=29729 RepID=A0A0B0PUP7_GOSAR|nr:hypothetical protein F383_11165 [Gossypium arboreum]
MLNEKIRIRIFEVTTSKSPDYRDVITCKTMFGTLALYCDYV